MRRSRSSLVVGSVASAVVAAGMFACGDVSGGSDSVLSIQFDSLAAPSVVVGDTLRDTTGAVVRPSVHAFNFSGAEITAPPVWFQSPDSGVTVDSLTGIVVGDSLRATSARIIATVGSLQAIQKVDVTLRPDTIFAVHGLDSVTYSLIDSTKNLSVALTVELSHGVSPNDSVVKSYIVSFNIVSQPDPQFAQLTNDQGKPSIIDTTGTDGIAGRAIRVHPLSLPMAGVTDSVIVDATAKYRGVAVSGSPVRLVLRFKPQ